MAIMPCLCFSPDIRALKDGPVVGPKVLDKEAFTRIVFQQVPEFIANTEPDEDGNWFVPLPIDVLPLVSSGVGRGSKDPRDYVMRSDRCRVGLFLKREHALLPERCGVFVVTKGTYLAECQEYEEEPLDDAALVGITHVVVSVRIEAGPAGFRQRPHDFVKRLARLVGEPDRAKVIAILNDAWRIDKYWQDFAEVSD